MSYITMKNAKYYNELSVESREKMTVEFNVKFFKHLISKYKKIIKSNKKSQDIVIYTKKCNKNAQLN